MITEAILNLAERGDFRTAALASMGGRFKWGDFMGTLALRAEARKRGRPMPSASGSGTEATPAKTMTPHEVDQWQRRVDAAYHEAGHVITVLAMGHKLHAAVVRGPNDGEVTFNISAYQSLQFPLGEAVISWGGPLASNRHSRGSYQDDERGLSDSDAEPIRAVARRLDPSYPWDHLGSPSSLQARQIARDIVERHWHSVVAVACALLGRGSLTGDEIRALVPGVVNACV